MLRDLLLVGAGSCLGGMSRYLISLFMKEVGTGFPWGTLAVNLAGCFFIGFFHTLSQRYLALPAHFTLFLTTGFCGGFTTFSTFSKEGLALLQAGNLSGFAAYVLVSVVLGLGFVALGYFVPLGR